MKDYIMTRIFKASNGIAQGIFVTLGIGLLVENIGKMTDVAALIAIGSVAKSLMAPGIGAGIAFMLGANGLVIFSAMIAAAVGAGAISLMDVGLFIKPGEPIGALLTATAAVYIGKKISGKTPVDMMLVPLVTTVAGGLIGIGLSRVMTPILTTVGGAIKEGASVNPLVASIVIAVVWGLLLISPASSAALAIALNLDGIAGGAALAGCVAQFVGFAVISYKENNLGGVMAQAICTPKVQLPNITKNPYIMLPTVIASAFVGPVATLVFNIEAGKEIAGMGLSSLIAPIKLMTTYDLSFIVPAMLVSYFAIPITISYFIYRFMKKKNYIKQGDLTLPQ